MTYTKSKTWIRMSMQKADVRPFLFIILSPATPIAIHWSLR